MKKLSLAMLVVLGLMLTFTPMISAYAQVQLPANISFKGYALGKCGIARTTYSPSGGQNVQLIWYGAASGSVVLNGHGKATSYQPLGNGMDVYYQISGNAYLTAPGDTHAVGALGLKWSENHELHQLCIVIFSERTSQGVFQPETDKFLAGFSPSGATEGSLGYSGIYRIGSNVQYFSGLTGIWASEGDGTEYIHVVLIYGEPLQYVIHIVWSSEAVSTPMPNGETWIIPAATTLVHDVKLL